ncbi:alcohol dehydrogenase [Pseudomonas syringae pv. tomato]|uniref:NAD(P)-dependent alcohol dehydrogenase n=5 Tax=Pseudomonas syringae group TaxID=136849 RepID=A0AAW4E1N2_PSESX|nr:MULTISPECIES: NAD(P)-dependent alcohol dehydrogenase [Pseudomonas syringae group]KPC05695.1 Oxidoreductase [Pseudomonas amygdali pv. lachrymans]AVI83550.1 alcohol dehydrogenase [Pseudomonas syringae pv. tomato]EEB60510.1 oxidoreductase, zinc-binding [Pseudomonas syringae pv. tomato T1]EGH95221.1 oxidoreductase, zinc-binding protein [Pseudomonas amygdali pv. lachrymans str. M302278]KGK95433.1 alcohol dehydrogenase [Pseudomonas syringae pv. tomato]
MSNTTIYVQAGGGYDQVSVGESEVLAPKSGEITVRLHANSLNYHDFAVVTGMWAPTEKRIPMADGAGVVTAVGEGVSEFKVGDSVVSTFFPEWISGEPLVEGFVTVPGDGVDGYAREQVTARATSFTRAPLGYSHAEASTLTTAGLTAWRALMVDDSLKAGDTVLVQGTGGVSIFALQFAKMVGATVIATSSSDEKLERLQAMGADHLINYRKDSNWGETARKLTGGRGVDHIIDVGGPSTLQHSMNAARVAGHISVIGILSGVAGQLEFVPALVKQLRMQGVLVGSRIQQQDMIRAIDANGMRPVMDRSFPMTDIVEAFKYQETNQHFGKICLDI